MHATTRLGALLAGAALLAGSGAAQAGGNVYWSVGIQAPLDPYGATIGTTISNAPLYRPAPVVVVPAAPVYVRPAPVYAPPVAVYYPPAPVVYTAPRSIVVRPAPVYVARPPVYEGWHYRGQGPRWQHRHDRDERWDRRDHRRGDRHDRRHRD